MATTSTDIQDLYANIVADVVPFYEDAVLLPNALFMGTQYNIENTAGNTVQIPLVNDWTDASSVAAGGSIATANTDDFDPTSVSLTLTKKGKATDVHSEALEDGGAAMVEGQIITRLSRGLAQATDITGFAAMDTAFAANEDGASAAYASYEANMVVSPEAFAYGIKRQPTVNMFYNVDTDTHQFRATIRNGFANLRSAFGRRVSSNAVVGDATANTVVDLADFAKAVANLRAANAPTMGNGLYPAFIGPATENAILAQLGNVSSATIPSLSELGNQALMMGAVGQAVGCMFFRTNNLPTVDKS
jgi:hypothetical protein